MSHKVKLSNLLQCLHDSGMNFKLLKELTKINGSRLKKLVELKHQKIKKIKSKKELKNELTSNIFEQMSYHGLSEQEIDAMVKGIFSDIKLINYQYNLERKRIDLDDYVSVIHYLKNTNKTKKEIGDIHKIGYNLVSSIKDLEFPDRKVKGISSSLLNSKKKELYEKLKSKKYTRKYLGNMYNVSEKYMSNLSKRGVN